MKSSNLAIFARCGRWSMKSTSCLATEPQGWLLAELLEELLPGRLRAALRDRLARFLVRLLAQYFLFRGSFLLVGSSCEMAGLL